jgi:hypothetical protein
LVAAGVCALASAPIPIALPANTETAMSGVIILFFNLFFILIILETSKTRGETRVPFA